MPVHAVFSDQSAHDLQRLPPAKKRPIFTFTSAQRGLCRMPRTPEKPQERPSAVPRTLSNIGRAPTLTFSFRLPNSKPVLDISLGCAASNHRSSARFQMWHAPSLNVRRLFHGLRRCELFTCTQRRTLS